MNAIKLQNGNLMPVLGLGTWRSKPHEAGDAVKYALTEAGYTHVDCAAIYDNEKEIGEAFSDVFSSKVKRENVFITSKLWNTDHASDDVIKACKQTLSDLKLDYLDLYLMHWGIALKYTNDKSKNTPNANIPIFETWQAMEELVDLGLVRSIGVANFNTMMIHDLLSYASHAPQVNQIELHPYLAQTELVEYCQDRGVAVTAYSPLGTPGTKSADAPDLMADEVITKLAEKYSKTPAQILIRWAIQRNTIVIPKSTKPKRIVENTAVFDFEISDVDFIAIKQLDKKLRFVNPRSWWDVPYFE